MNIKLIPFLVLTLCFFQVNAQKNTAKSTELILNEAFAQATKENKNVMVLFHASWCGWCKRMDKQMMTKECKPLFEKNYVIKHLVVKESDKNKHLENPGSLALLKKYKGDKSGIPFWLIFDQNGDLLEDSFNTKGENLGCPASKEEVAAFIEILKKTSSLNAHNLSVIDKTFYLKK